LTLSSDVFINYFRLRNPQSGVQEDETMITSNAKIKNYEGKVARLLEKRLEVKFEKQPLCNQDWGKPDRWSKICSNKYLFLEVEKSQHHPCTNVLKVGPFLKENSNSQVFLVQAFFRGKSDGTRVLLCKWIADVFNEKLFRKRFRYCRISVSKDCKTIDEEDSLKKEFYKFCSKRKQAQ
jgi:hypothetical protein